MKRAKRNMNTAALLRKAEHDRKIDETRQGQTRQGLFECGMRSLDAMPARTCDDEDMDAEPYYFSDRGRSAARMFAELDEKSRQKRRKTLINLAAAKLPRKTQLYRKLLWAIYRNGADRKRSIAELSIDRGTYWRGIKIFLTLFKAR